MNIPEMFHLINILQSNNSIEFHQRLSTMMIICNFFLTTLVVNIFHGYVFIHIILLNLTWLGMAFVSRFISVINFQNVFHCQYFWSNHNADSAFNTYSLFVWICFAPFKWFYANSETKAVRNFRLFFIGKIRRFFFSCSLFWGRGKYQNYHKNVTFKLLLSKKKPENTIYKYVLQI